MKMKPKDDPTIARIRAVRHRISQQFDHDPQKLVAHYIALQEAYRRRVSTQSTAESTTARGAESRVAIREDSTKYVVEDQDLLALFQGEE